MDAQTIQLVQDSWEKDLPISGVAGPLFSEGSSLIETLLAIKHLFA